MIDNICFDSLFIKEFYSYYSYKVTISIGVVKNVLCTLASLYRVLSGSMSIGRMRLSLLTFDAAKIIKRYSFLAILALIYGLGSLLLYDSVNNLREFSKSYAPGPYLRCTLHQDHVANILEQSAFPGPCSKYS